MLLTRIIAHHFKTYLALDMDLSVSAEKPLILIGGANGGGKTTLFEAIYGALYGLQVQSERAFQELYNTGESVRLASEEIRHISLEIRFIGTMYGEQKEFTLTRRYELSPNQTARKPSPPDSTNTSAKAPLSKSIPAKNIPIEYVKLSVAALQSVLEAGQTSGSTLYAYNTAQTQRERAKHLVEIAKLIKANLPEELSRYFLFDAMESGALLREDRINTVIRENIENVMGFGKYVQLARAAESVAKRLHAERLNAENEKQEYTRLLSDEQREKTRKMTLEKELHEAKEFQRKNQMLYNALKTELSEESALAKTMEQAQKEVELRFTKQRSLHAGLSEFVRNFEQHIVFPKLADAFHSELQTVFATKAEREKSGRNSIKPDSVKKLVKDILRFATRKNLLANSESEYVSALEAEMTEYVLSGEAETAQADFYPFLNAQELQALERLSGSSFSNPFVELHKEQVHVRHLMAGVEELEANLEEWRKHGADKDFSLLRTFDRNAANIDVHERELELVNAGLTTIQQRLHDFDIQLEQAVHPKFDMAQKLAPFFIGAGEALLRAKKRQIELRMMQDLNVNLVAYRGVIDRVELSDSLDNITFKLYHTSGNEIYLNQLNTASKQVVVQCLLKALHEFGEYNPPVMIDTVMGALDEASRDAVLENYFPELAHQTILLSTDSEIRPDRDFALLKPHIARTYTLRRDKERQCTVVEEGYFGRQDSLVLS